MKRFKDILLLIISLILFILFSILKNDILIFLSYIPLLFVIIYKNIKIKKINEDFIILLVTILLFIINKKIDIFLILFIYNLYNKICEIIYKRKNIEVINEKNKKIILYKIITLSLFIIISIILYLLKIKYTYYISIIICGLIISCTNIYKYIYQINMNFISNYNNIKIKDNILNKLYKIESIFIDKSMVIKKYKMIKLIPYYKKEEELLDYIGHTEYKSNNKIALAIKNCCKIDKNRISEYREYDCNGIEAKIDNDYVMIGNEKLFNDLKIEYPKVEFIDTSLLVALNNVYIGTIVLENILDGNILDFTKNLNKIGINDINLVSSDKNKIVKKVALKLNIKNYYSDISKNDKIELMKNKNAIYFSNDYKQDDNIITCNFKDGDIITNNIMDVIKLIDISKKIYKRIKLSIIINFICKLLSIILILFNLKYYYIFIIIDLISILLNLKKVKGDII